MPFREGRGRSAARNVMSDTEAYTAVVEVASAPSHAEGAPNLVAVSGPLMTLTWVTFIIMSFVLYKVAWKPILRALDEREKSIRKAMDDAEKARAELALMEERGRKTVAEADARGREIVEAARAAAGQMTEANAQRAKAESQAMIEAARREIEAAAQKARTELRAESADLAVRLAAKVVGDALDAAGSRAYVEKLLREMKP